MIRSLVAISALVIPSVAGSAQPTVSVSALELIASSRQEGLKAASYVDVDHAERNEVSAADLRFAVSQGSQRFYAFIPVNGALAAPAGDATPDPDGCQALRAEMTADAIPEISAGSALCVYTSTGQIARVTVESTDNIAADRITISFRTWPLAP